MKFRPSYPLKVKHRGSIAFVIDSKFFQIMNTASGFKWHLTHNFIAIFNWIWKMNFYNKKSYHYYLNSKIILNFSWIQWIMNTNKDESVPGKPCPVFKMTHYLYTLVSKLIKYQYNCRTDWKRPNIAYCGTEF